MSTSRVVTTVVPVAHRHFLKMHPTRYRLLLHECLVGQRLSFHVCPIRYSHLLELRLTLYTHDMYFMYDVFHFLSSHHVTSRTLHYTSLCRLFLIGNVFFSPTPHTVSHRRYLTLFYLGNEIRISDAYSSLFCLASLKFNSSTMQ